MKYAVKLGLRHRTLWVVSLYGHPRSKTEAIEWYMSRGKSVSKFIGHGPAEDPKAFNQLMRLRYMRGYVVYRGEN